MHGGDFVLYSISRRRVVESIVQHSTNNVKLDLS